MRLLSALIVLSSLASPAFADCEAGTPDCPDILLHPLPDDANRETGDPSLYADPTLAPSEDNGETLAPTHEQEDTPDTDPGVLTVLQE